MFSWAARQWEGGSTARNSWARSPACMARGMCPTPAIQVRLARSQREPDVRFVAIEHPDRMRPAHLDRPAEMVVEIVSPASVARDHRNTAAACQEADIPD